MREQHLDLLVLAPRDEPLVFLARHAGQITAPSWIERITLRVGWPGQHCGLSAHPCVRRHPIIRSVSNDVEKLIDPVPADRRHDPELGEVRPQRVRQLCPLTAENQTDPAQHHRALLLGRLDPDEAHGGSRHRFADRLGIGSVVLAPLD